MTGYRYWIALIAYWLVWRGIQDYVNMPHMMGKGLDFHPGIFLSIPTVAAVLILWMNWTRRISVRKAS